MIGAAVDCGSNSVHLLVARIDDDGLEYLDDESELLGLGDVVDAYGELPEESVEILVHSLSEYRDKAVALGASSVTLLGTEPLRRARNGAEVAREVESQLGLPMRILNRQEEGELTFIGVTGGRRPSAALLVVDIGGGSTEVVVYEPAAGIAVDGAPVGSARLWLDYVENDPPTDAEIMRLRAAAASAIDVLPRAAPTRAIFVGGTATNLVRLQPLRRGAFDAVFATLKAATAAEIAERYGTRLRRAHQLAPGAALVEAILDHYGLIEAEASDASLRDGAILQAAGRTTSLSA